jgi:hypothetical protein
MESRVVRNTERLLEIFDEFEVHSTFFVLGWVAERHPRWCDEFADAGHELASHGYAHRLVYDQTPRAFRRMSGSEKADRGCLWQRGARIPGPELLDHAAFARALDVCLEEGYEYDSASSRFDTIVMAFPSRSGCRTRFRSAAGSLVEVPGVDDQSRSGEPSGRRRRVFPYPAVPVDALGHVSREPAGGPPGDLLSASMGN